MTPERPHHVVVQQGSLMVRQIERRLRGQPLLPCQYRDFGSLVSLGVSLGDCTNELCLAPHVLFWAFSPAASPAVPRRRSSCTDAGFHLHHLWHPIHARRQAP